MDQCNAAYQEMENQFTLIKKRCKEDKKRETQIKEDLWKTQRIFGWFTKLVGEFSDIAFNCIQFLGRTEGHEKTIKHLDCDGHKMKRKKIKSIRKEMRAIKEV